MITLTFRIRFCGETEDFRKLEKYALDNYLGGVPVFDNGAAVLYSKRVQLPTKNYTYIPIQALV